jgi:hypothetical protein
VCINPGEKHPKAENKGSFGAGGNFPVQSGKADFDVSLTVNIQPDCTPPMTLEFTNIKVLVCSQENVDPVSGTCTTADILGPVLVGDGTCTPS